MTVIQQRVLVTGGSGFIAGHCILQLLEQGYLVRTTVRSLSAIVTFGPCSGTPVTSPATR